MLVFALILSGCSSKDDKGAPSVTSEPTQAVTDVPGTDTAPDTSVNGQDPVNDPAANGVQDAGSADAGIPDMTPYESVPAAKDYIELALNVYYNDASTSYFSNESGSQHIYVTGEGQYALSFDCESDLSDEARAAGVSSLKNLTAVYITDMQVIAGTGQSPLTSCNIMYDRVTVDGNELTVTLPAPKAAFKVNGVFDTNDPVNSWDGSWVEEVEAAEHVANFTTVKDPKKITVVFTLSDLVWGSGAADGDTGEGGDSGTAGQNTEGANNAVFSSMDLTDMDARTLSYYMGNGINLGERLGFSIRRRLGTAEDHKGNDRGL